MELIAFTVRGSPVSINKAAQELDGRSYNLPAVPRVGEDIKDDWCVVTVTRVIHNVNGSIEVHVK